MQNRNNPLRAIARIVPVPYLEAGVLVFLGLVAAYFG